VNAPWPRRGKGSRARQNFRGRDGSRILITERPAGSTVRLELHGEIDIGTVGQVRGAIVASLARHAPSTLVLDFRHVSAIDSMSLGELVTCDRTTAARGTALMLENLAPFPHQQLWATGLLRLLGLSGDEPRAAESDAALTDTSCSMFRRVADR
jgi:anti-anti-sigma factor